MATKLDPVTIKTPHNATVVTPVIKRPIWGRVYDTLMIVLAFVAALLAGLGDFNFASLGFSPTQTALIGLVIFCVRFALAWQPPKLLDVKTDPLPPGGQG